MKHSRLAALLLALPAACRATPPAPDPWADRAGAVADPELDLVCRSTWAWRLDSDPVRATYLGDPRSYGELVLPTPERRDADREQAQRLLDEVRAMPEARLTEADRLTCLLLREELGLDVAEADLAIDMASWNLDPRGGPQNSLLSLAAFQPVATPAERAALLERWRRMPAYVDQCAANLRRGVAHGRVASRTAVTKTIEQLDHVLATEPCKSPLAAPAAGSGRWLDRDDRVSMAALAARETGGSLAGDDLTAINRYLAAPSLADARSVLVPAADDALTPQERGRFLEDVLLVVQDEIYPAFRRYRDTIAAEVLPIARSDDEPGIVYVAGGPEAYRVATRRYTSLDKTPEEIHAIGLAEVARIRSRTQELGQHVFGTADFGEIQKRLRTDPALYFTSREEIEAKARDCLARANAAVPRCFSLLPRTPCEVVRVPEHEEKDTTIAYYQEPSADGSRPGRYYINTYAPTTRPRFDAEALAWHESVPGHHFQIAIAFELKNLPPVRRYAGQNAFVEGWALYTEKLADELGLYSSDLDRLGMLSFDAWRASRLVVDTGLHAQGWSRERAIRYLVDNTLLAPNNAENEVDRYISWPGQALGYMLGRLEIQRLRALAQEQLGPRFSLPEFHRQVLQNGAITLAMLDGVIERWIAAESAH